MTKKRINVVDSNILIMGFTFKENCLDIRNTRVVDLVHDFEDLLAMLMYTIHGSIMRIPCMNIA